MAQSKLKAFFLGLSLFIGFPQAFTQDHIIFSIAQDIPMGIQDEVRQKNFYVNMGSQQGLRPGVILGVYRTISRLDPFAENKRHRYQVKIGELEVLHAESDTAIATFAGMSKDPRIYTEINALMIGDRVQVKVD